MMRHTGLMRIWNIFILVFSLGLAQTLVFSADTEKPDRMAMYYRYLKIGSYVKGGICRPHWMADGNSFWYVEGVPDRTNIYIVSPESNEKKPLFDTVRLRQSLAAQLGHEPPYEGVPFQIFAFVQGEKAIRFSLEGKNYTEILFFFHLLLLR